MKLDSLLEQAALISPRDPTERETTRHLVVQAARDEISRRARIVRRRRRNALVACLGALVVGAVVVRVGAPADPAPSVQERAGANSTVAFLTVADVVNAAAAAPLTGPRNAPFWKVVMRISGTSCTDKRCHPSADLTTYWMGLDKPGVEYIPGIRPGKPDKLPIGLARVTIDGQRMTWRQANNTKWTIAQLKTIQFDGFNPDHGIWLTVPNWYRVGYDTGYALLTAPASQTIRQQLWKILGTLPELRFDGHATDALGRSGWRLTLPSAGPGWPSHSFIVDTATGVLLEAQYKDPQSPSALTVESAGAAETAPTPDPPCPGSHPAKGEGVSVCQVTVTH